MKCHACNQNLEKSNFLTFELECPDQHVFLNKIQYVLYVDLDPLAQKRLKILSNHKSTQFVLAGYPTFYEKVLLSIPRFIPLKIKNETIDIEDLISKFNKLKCFA